MLKGYRGPLLALLFSLFLLVAVIATRPPDVSTPAPLTSTQTLPPPNMLAPSPTALPTLTPAPTIPFQRLDTQTLNEAVIGCYKKLNPLLAGYNQTDRDIVSLIFEGLATTDAYGNPVPDLAGSWIVSSDGLVYAVRLRTDVLWHDGTPFTSGDVLFTIHLMQDPGFPGPTDLHNFWQTVEVDAIDEHTVRFKLAQPLAAFLDYLRIGILPEHVLRNVAPANLSGQPFNLAPIGTGPYQFDALIGNGNQPTGIRLRFAATYSQRPEGKDGYALRQIVFRCTPSYNDAIAAFQRGDVNSVSQLPPDAIQQVSGLTQLTLYTAYPPAFGAVIYNWQRGEVGYFRDFRMRQALARSVDRVALVNKFMAGRAVPADNPIIPNSWARAADVSCPAFNPDNPTAAQTLLSQVQIQPTPALDAPPPPPPGTAPATPPPSSGPGTQPPDQPLPPTAIPDYRFQLLVNNDPALANMAAEIVNSWKKLGLKTNVVVVDTATFKERLVAGNFDAALVELNLAPNADPDPYSLWRQIPKDGGLNFGGMNERRMSELVESARREVNGVHRADLYKQFQQLFCDRAAALLLYYPVYTYGADQRITGIQFGFMSDPVDRFRTIQAWRFVQQ